MLNSELHKEYSNEDSYNFFLVKGDSFTVGFINVLLSMQMELIVVRE